MRLERTMSSWFLKKLKEQTAPKKSSVKRKILRKIMEWDGSQPEMKMASEILEVIEKAGMRPTKMSYIDGWRKIQVITSWKSETYHKAKRK